MKVKKLTNEQLIMATLARILGWIAGQEHGYRGHDKIIKELEKRAPKKDWED
mgnify:CR=1 FL=1